MVVDASDEDNQTEGEKEEKAEHERCHWPGERATSVDHRLFVMSVTFTMIRFDRVEHGDATGQAEETGRDQGADQMAFRMRFAVEKELGGILKRFF